MLRLSIRGVALNQKSTIHIDTYELIKPAVISGVVLSAATSRRLLFQCLRGLYSECPGNAVERKANQWIRVWTGVSLSLLIENLD